MRHPVFGLAAALILVTVGVGAGGTQAPAYKDHEVTFTNGAVTIAVGLAASCRLTNWRLAIAKCGLTSKTLR